MEPNVENVNARWRISASLILVAPNANPDYDYNLLMLKRSDATAMVYNQTVFPGGMLDPDADESVAWLDYFEKFGVPQAALRDLVLISDNRPAILAPQGTGCYDRFFKRSKIWAREITLRLTALRECFEEVGILLCRSQGQLEQRGSVAQSDHPDFDLESWQRRVHNKPSEFLELCRHLKVVPDLWALHEWSVWASPAFFKKRHETVFFMVFLNSAPNLLAEPTEVKECLWRPPTDLLRLHQLGELWFLPPQIYELSRLLGVKSYEQLLEFTLQRSKLGSTLFIPVSYNCIDGIMYTLPGDDFYVPEPHLVTNFIEFPGTLADLRARSKHLHRYEFSGPLVLKIFFNITPLNGHLEPKELPSVHKL